MGIHGLPKIMRAKLTTVSIKTFERRIVGVDAQQWAYQGALAQARDFCLETSNDRWIKSVLRKVETLKSYNVIPYLVFDGNHVPIKSEENKKRDGFRSDNLLSAKAYEAKGEHEKALECYKNAVKITPPMLKRLLHALEEKGIRFLVAPYEADPQLVHMANNCVIDIILSTDTDLMAYGVPRMLFEFEKGNGLLFESEKVGEYFEDLDQKMFTEACILAGSDYSTQLLPIDNAITSIRKCKTWEKVLEDRRDRKETTKKKFHVPDNYEEQFKNALLMFNHATVFDVNLGQTCSLKAVTDDKELPKELLGSMLTDEVARGIAEGRLDPITKQPF